LDKIIKQRKGKLTIDDWIICMQSHGIPADKISDIVKAPIPHDLYLEIAVRQERTAKKAETILYNTSHLPETDNIYYKDSSVMDFDAKIIEVFANVLQKNATNIVILDQSAVYPTSGGQQHDTGVLTLDGTEYQIVDATKVGKCVLHTLDKPLEGDIDSYKGKSVHVSIDQKRR